MQTNLSQSIDITAEKAKYDESVKELSFLLFGWNLDRPIGTKLKNSQKKMWLSEKEI